MYAIPTTPQVWGNITQASCLSEMLDLVRLAHDLGLDEREFWARQRDSENHYFWIALRPGNKVRIRYSNNLIEIVDSAVLADIFGEAMADGLVYSQILDTRGQLAQASGFVERRSAS